MEIFFSNFFKELFLKYVELDFFSCELYGFFFLDFKLYLSTR